MKETTLIGRLESLLYKLGISMSQFAYELEISADTISKITTHDVIFWMEVYPKIVNRYPDVNSLWLLFGTGSMLKSESDKEKLRLNEFEVTMIDNMVIDVKGMLTDKAVLTIFFKVFKQLFNDYQRLLVENPKYLTKPTEVQNLWISTILARTEEMINKPSDYEE